MLIVVNGPIAAGKSTFSSVLADALPRGERPVAVVGLDEIFFMIRMPGAGLDEQWEVARVAHASLIRSLLGSGVTVVAEGPFYDDHERALLLSDLGDGVDPFFITLVVSYDEALRRVGLDGTRGISADPAFLRWAHDNFWSARRSSVREDLVLDTLEATPEELAAVVIERLAASSGS